MEYPRMRWLVLVAGGMCLLACNMFMISLSAILPQMSQSLNITVGTATNFMGSLPGLATLEACSDFMLPERLLARREIITLRSP
jgi:hypothetical protein